MKSSIIKQDKALELIRQKYPTAEYWYNEIEQTYNIAFEAQGKVYSYRCFNTLEFLKRIKILDENIIYKKDYDSYIKSINKTKQYIEDIKNNKAIYFLITKENALYEAEKELKRLQNIINKCKVLDI
jgi:hypothetical protein